VLWKVNGARTLAIAGLTLLLFYACATLADALSRTVLDSSIEIVSDLAAPVIAVALSACFPYGFAARSNIVVTVIDPFLPKPAIAWLAAFAWFLTLIVLAAFSYQFFVYSDDLLTAQETTAIYAIPIAPFWFVVALNLSYATLIHASIFRAWMAAAGAESAERSS
jgi:TRAP-type C4-dicarboxylate transport system permease small subunit